MKCPNCGADNNYTSNSRERGDRVWRRRLCNNCGLRFTTYEVYVPSGIKKGSKEFNHLFDKGGK